MQVINIKFGVSDFMFSFLATQDFLLSTTVGPKSEKDFLFMSHRVFSVSGADWWCPRDGGVLL